MINNVCKECFLDEELRGFIVAQGNVGNCDCCKTTGIEIIKINELYEFFSELLSNFQTKEQGESVVNKLQGNWGFFKNIQIANAILNNILPEIQSNIQSIDDRVDFTDEIKQNINYCQQLKEQLKWEMRYLTNIYHLTDDLGWDGFFNSKIALTKDDTLFRARLHSKSSQNPFSLDEMGCPPKDISTGGRSNPAGIPYLYLSDNQETILYEIRASYLDEVSIGTFTIADHVENEIIISDFTEVPTLFHPSEVNKRIKSTLLKRSISIDLSKPMRRYDSELDYIPTQFICEFIKVFTGVHGIKFRSSLHPVGNNIVVFDKNNLTCRTVEKHQISKVAITGKKLD